MQSIRIIVGIALLVCAASAAKAEGNVSDDNACMEGPMAQFGRYVGDWNIEDESLAQDGSGLGAWPRCSLDIRVHRRRHGGAGFLDAE